MTTLQERAAQIVSDNNEPQIEVKIRAERRAHRRADLEQQGLTVERWDGARRVGKPFGQIIDLSAGGVRIRTEQQNIRPENQIRLRLELPEYAGICPFVDASGPSLQPKREWVGWLAVSRVQKVDEKRVDVAGRLVDMEDLDRGMLSLYLSAQPLAA
ncbi:MAG TPA: PilZ domain-containing protein [Tepidisphaeraceae bacterium]|nr:PilZ domain-containing protein [Tepidisphaeraceae bacterium]